MSCNIKFKRVFFWFHLSSGKVSGAKGEPENDVFVLDRTVFVDPLLETERFATFTLVDVEARGIQSIIGIRGNEQLFERRHKCDHQPVTFPREERDKKSLHRA
jgi:hypothetical protein